MFISWVEFVTFLIMEVASLVVPSFSLGIVVAIIEDITSDKDWDSLLIREISLVVIIVDATSDKIWISFTVEFVVLFCFLF